MITVARIVDVVSQEFDVSAVDIRSMRRNARAMVPRHVAMYLARHVSLRSLPEIGRYFSHRHHTSVMHGVQRAEIRLAASPELAARVGRLRDQLELEDARCA